MRTIYLRLPSRAAWRALALAADDALRIDVVAIIREPTGEEDAQGEPITAPIQGYHVNILVTDDRDLAMLDPYVVTPAEPVRVWAGAEA